MTRQRPHPLVDLLLGCILLAGVVAWIAGISPELAGLLVVAVSAGCLFNLQRWKRQQRRRRSQRRARFGGS